MSQRETLEATLERLAGIRRDPPPAAEVCEILRGALASRSSHAVAAAANLVADLELTELAPDLVEAFERFLRNPIKTDPGCRAKTAITDALQALDAWEGELYLRAVRHVQLEPVYGGREDTAAALRGAAARGLVRMNHPDAMLVLAELLADPELPARVAAARAIGYHGGEQGLPLLRLRILIGDPEMEMQGDCMLAMLQISPGSSIPFVAGLRDSQDEALAETAALALGESRAREALPVLTACWKRTANRRLARAVLLAIAMMRDDDAVAFLLSLISNEPGPIARDAIGAFEIYRNDHAMVERVRETARSRTDLDLSRAVEEVLG